MTSTSIWRPVVVTLSAVVMAVGTLAGFGLLGTRVEDSAGGVFSADATLVTPAGPAFSIWSLIYLGLLGYVIWQWRARSSERAARITWLAAASMVLNAAWLGVTQVGWLWPSVIVILALALVLGLLLQRLGETPPASTVEAVLVDGTFGVYLGWVSVATVANVATVLVASGVDPAPGVATTLAIVVLAVAVLLGALFAARLGGRWGIALAMAWALAWIAVGRLTTGPASPTVAVTAAVAALAILGITALFRARRAQSTPAPARTGQALGAGRA